MFVAQCELAVVAVSWPWLMRVGRGSCELVVAHVSWTWLMCELAVVSMGGGVVVSLKASNKRDVRHVVRSGNRSRTQRRES